METTRSVPPSALLQTCTLALQSWPSNLKSIRIPPISRDCFLSVVKWGKLRGLSRQLIPTAVNTSSILRKPSNRAFCGSSGSMQTFTAWLSPRSFFFSVSAGTKVSEVFEVWEASRDAHSVAIMSLWLFPDSCGVGADVWQDPGQKARQQTNALLRVSKERKNSSICCGCCGCCGC